jgi:hypothetical protein
VPAAKRKILAKRQLHNYRAEPGRFVDFQSTFSSTYAVMLDKIAHATDRLVYSINVTFDDTDFIHGSPPSLQAPGSLQVHLPAIPVLVVAAAEEANSGEHNDPLFDAASSLPQQLQLPCVNIEPMQWPPEPAQADEYHNPEHTQFTLNGDGTPQSRPRPTYEGQCNMVNSVIEDDGQYTALDLINSCQVSTLTHICLHLA